MTRKRQKLTATAEIALASVALAADESAPSQALDFMTKAVARAARRVPAKDRDSIRRLLENNLADSEWMARRQRRFIAKKLGGLLELMAGFESQERSEIPLVELLIPLEFSPPKYSRLLEYVAEIERKESALRLRLTAAGDLHLDHLRKALEARVEQGFAWAEMVLFFVWLGLLLINLGFMRGEFSVLLCDECSYYFVQTGKYHRKRPHSFCSTRCRVAFHRSVRGDAKKS